MKRMVHYNSNGFVEGHTRVYENGEHEMPSLLAWIIAIFGIIFMFKISGINLAGLFNGFIF